MEVIFGIGQTPLVRLFAVVTFACACILLFRFCVVFVVFVNYNDYSIIVSQFEMSALLHVLLSVVPL